MKKTSEKIIEYISEKGQASGKELADFFGITDRAIRKQLRILFESGKIKKIGKPPKVFYILPKKKYRDRASTKNKKIENKNILPPKINALIKNDFLYITPRGERLEGISGFVNWCKNRSLDIEKKSKEYVNIYKKYNKLKKNNLISGKEKIKSTFEERMCLDDIFYADFYAWEVFGKTKLGQLLLYGKQSQDKKIISEVVEIVKPHINEIIENYEIDAVGFVPPTVKREIQFMKVLEEKLNIAIPKIKIEKAKTEIITPQKTLSKLKDRIDNAKYSMFVTDTREFSKILLIDDAVGSGATMNQIACKIKKAKVAKKVYGFSITGSIKGFDVISEI